MDKWLTAALLAILSVLVLAVLIVVVVMSAVRPAGVTVGVPVGAPGGGPVGAAQLAGVYPVGDFLDAGISVSGQGRASAKPDVARVSVGVETVAPTVGQAVADNQTRTNAVVSALKALGIADKDLQTSSYSVYPERSARPVPSGGQPEITGYRVSNQLSVTIRKIDQTSQVVDAATKAGANNVSGLRFTIDDPKPLQEQARAQAVADAKARAESLARLAGVTLGPVVRITESQSASPIARTALAAPAAGGATPVETGELDVNWSVGITYTIR